ncbi:MAG: phosphoadenosine phosphosulfate reductase family protein, partial [Proteobacteria bacterium]|nr:phosphoadenosine phosphosulfate reductase family protein [Pseudomonadota bacterium]
PLSNWTELDVWRYVARENIPVVPLYFAAPRPIVERDGLIIMRDDERMALLPGEKVRTETVRFRTLGCYPLTGAVRSHAANLDEIIAEMRDSRTTERQGRAIDHDPKSSMEAKKREGYF